MKTDFQIRAVQLDLARQMETPEFIRRFIDFLAENHFNTLFLYLEWRVRTKTFDIGAKDGYSAKELAEIVDYASTRGIDVIPGLASLGHAELILEQKKYEKFAELRDGVKGRFQNTKRHVFCPSLPETRKFLEGYFREVSAIFPSQYIHVGGDEAFDVGFCELCSKKAAEFAGEQNLYLEHFRFCHEVVTGKLKKRMMMWDDMSEYYPDAFDALPRDIVMVNWQYQRNVTGWLGHFTNLEFKDQLAHYEKLGFDYLTAPADYSWNCVETSTANVNGRKCLGGLLTMWEKKNSLLWKYFPLIAATGRLWSGLETTPDAAVEEAVGKVFGTGDSRLVHAISWYLENPQNNSGVNASALTMHDFFGPDRTDLAAVRAIAGAFMEFHDRFSGTVAGMVLDDIIGDLLTQEAACQVSASAFRMLYGLKAEPLSAIADELKDIGERRIAACVKTRTKRDSAFFRAELDNSLKAISDFEEHFKSSARMDVLFCLPDAYGAEHVSIRLRSGKEWITVADGVFKKNTSTHLFHAFFFLPENIVPEEAEIVMRGFAGEGVCHLSVTTRKGTFVPSGVSKVSGMVSNPAAVLSPDVTYAYFGFPCVIDSFHDRNKADALHSVRILLAPEK